MAYTQFVGRFGGGGGYMSILRKAHDTFFASLLYIPVSTYMLEGTRFLSFKLLPATKRDLLINPIAAGT